MKKFFLTVFIISVFLLGWVSLTPLPHRSTESVGALIQPTGTTVLPTITATKRTVVYPTPTARAPTPPPTPTPDPYQFDTVNLSTGQMQIEFTEGGLAGVVVKATLISPANLGGYESTSKALALGNKTGVVRPEKYGNILIGLHSGYFDGQPLEAEPFRFYFERWGKSGDEGDKYVAEKILSAIGSRGIISVNGYQAEVEVTGTVRMEHAASEKIQLHPEEILDIVTSDEFQKVGDTEAFKIAKLGTSHFVMINFCGWGPNQEPTYYRYVIILKISAENSATPLAYE